MIEVFDIERLSIYELTKVLWLNKICSVKLSYSGNVGFNFMDSEGLKLMLYHQNKNKNFYFAATLNRCIIYDRKTDLPGYY